jgi:hypothetical protein
MHNHLYRLGKKSIWGDYGSVLIHGLSPTRDESGHLLVRRAGPFAPPMMFVPVIGEGLTVLVTQTLKEKLVAADFGDLQFKPTIKHHIVDFDEVVIV